MEWLPQGSLAAKLERDGVLPTDAVVAIADQVLAALSALTAAVVAAGFVAERWLLGGQTSPVAADVGTEGN
jgi:hypothetical protein